MESEKADSMAWCAEQPGRFELELAAISACFPQAVHQAQDGITTIETPVHARLPLRRLSRQHRLLVTVPPSYPSTAPKAFASDIHFPKTTRGRIRRPPHLYDDDSLCLFYPEDPPELRWLPEDGIVTIMVWARDWLDAYYLWRFRNK